MKNEERRSKKTASRCLTYLNRDVSTSSRFFSLYPPNFHVKERPTLRKLE